MTRDSDLDAVAWGNGVWESFVVLFGFGPDSGISVVIHLDVDRIGSTADRTVLDIRLSGTLGGIQRDNDLLAASIADVTGFH